MALFDTELVFCPTAAKGRPLRRTAGISMADHHNPGTSCHLITEARLVGVRVVLVGSGSCEGSLGIFTPPRSSSSLGQRVALAKHPAASPPRPTAPRWLNTCPDLGISAGVAFNLLGGKSASRLGTMTSFCVVSLRMKPLPPSNGLGWRRAGGVWGSWLGLSPRDHLDSQALGTQFIRMHRGVARL